MFSFGQHPFGSSSLFDSSVFDSLQHPFGSSSPFDSSIFGNNTGQRRRVKGSDVIHSLRVSLADLYNGKMVKLQLRKRVICIKCNGFVCV
jgi:DnaJ-class molecular chaperone